MITTMFLENQLPVFWLCELENRKSLEYILKKISEKSSIRLHEPGISPFHFLSFEYLSCEVSYLTRKLNRAPGSRQ